MIWLSVRLNAQKAWLWIKHHWKVASIVLWTVVVWVIARKNTDAYKKVLDTTIANYKKQINVIDTSYQDEIEKRDKVLEIYNEVVTRLDKEYELELDDLTHEKKVAIKALIDSYYDEPEELNRRLQDDFGFTYVE